jgi:DNA-binding NtrC family response regulator
LGDGPLALALLIILKSHLFYSLHTELRVRVVSVSAQNDNKTKTILLVDDDPENVRNYSEILVELGYRVIARGKVDSALTLVEGNTALDLVITDYRMPGESGRDFIVALRHLRPRLPVIMITAYGNIETFLHSISLGAFEYVNKPITKKELERIVLNALNKNGRKKHPGRDDCEQYSDHR